MSNMNIEILRLESRIDVSGGGSSKVSALSIISNRFLWVGLNNGDLLIYRIQGTSHYDSKKDIKIPSDRPMKLLNDVRLLFNENSRDWTLEATVRNVTVTNSPITKIRLFSVAQQPNQANGKLVVAIGDNEAIRIYEYYNRNLKFLQEIENSKDFIDMVFTEDLLIFGVKKKLHVYKYESSGNRTSNLSLSKMRSSSSLNSGFGTPSTTTFQLLHEISLRERIRKIGHFRNQDLLVGLINDFVVVNPLNSKVLVLPAQNETLGLFNRPSLSSFSYFGLNNSSGPQTDITTLGSSNSILLSQDNLLIRYDYTELTLSQIHIKQLKEIPLSILYLEPCYLVLVFSKRFEIVDYDSGELAQSFNHQLNTNSMHIVKFQLGIYLAGGTDLFKFHLSSPDDQIRQFLKEKEPRIPKKRTEESDLELTGLEKAISYISRLEETNKYFEDLAKPLKLRSFYLKKSVILFERYFKFHEALVELGSEWMVSYKQILNLFPDFLNGEVQITGTPTTIQTNNSNPIKSISLENLQRFEVHTGESGTDNETDKGVKTTPTKPTEIKRFTRAVNNLIVYLTDQRRIILTFEATAEINWHGIDLKPEDFYEDMPIEHVSSVIDTSLFLCYYHTKPMLLGPLLRLPNNRCNSKVVNERLLEKIHLHDMNLTLPAGYIKELLDFYFGRSLHREALEMLYKLAHDKKNSGHGDEFDDFLKKPDLTVQYLQKLGNNELDLIFEFSTWFLKVDNLARLSLCESIFMNDSYECESYDGFKVLDYLSEVIGESMLVIRYLEWLIKESDVIDKYRKNLVQKFHTRLCLQYLEKLKQNECDLESFNESKLYQKLYTFLDTTVMYEPWTVLKNIPTSDSKFLRFTVLIYKRLGEHDKSIDVLFNQLDDLDSAMAYCSTIYVQPHFRVTGKRLLHKLLEDLLLSGSDNQDRVERLLNQEGSKMSILDVLTALPNSFPMERISEFLSNTLRNSQENLHDTRIATQLYKVGLIKLKSDLLELQKESYEISNSSQKCFLCKKNLGYGIFCADKMGSISHYSCYQQQNPQH